MSARVYADSVLNVQQKESLTQLGVMKNQTWHRTMTRKERRPDQSVESSDGDFLRAMVRPVIQEFLNAEMRETIGAQKKSGSKGAKLSQRLLCAPPDYTRTKA
jgi:transposase-like protein